MKILLLESSGNRKGSSKLLADNFARGAQEAGHEVESFDVIRADIRPCRGCGTVSMTVSTEYPQRAYDLGRSLGAVASTSKREGSSWHNL